MAGALAIAGASIADGQTCLGRASFRHGSARVGANYRSVSVYGGEVGYGKPGSLFGIVQGDAWQSNHEPDNAASWKRVMLAGGTQLEIKSSGFELCPLAAVGFYFSGQARNNTGYDSDYTGRQYELGGAIGYSGAWAAANGTQRAASSWTTIPSLGLRWVRQTSSGTWRYGNGQQFTGSPPAYDYGLATFTFGIANNALTISPFLQKQLGTRFTSTNWGIGFGYNVGK
jgi:hypothetical protein